MRAQSPDPSDCQYQLQAPGCAKGKEGDSPHSFCLKAVIDACAVELDCPHPRGKRGGGPAAASGPQGVEVKS